MVKFPVAEPVHTPVTVVEPLLTALVRVEVDTILLTVMPFGAELLEVMPLIVNGVPVVTLLGAVAFIVVTLVAHSAFVEKVAADAFSDIAAPNNDVRHATNTSRFVIFCFIFNLLQP